MSHVNDMYEAERLELNNREVERLLHVSARARRVMAECNRALAVRREDSVGDSSAAAELTALLRS